MNTVRRPSRDAALESRLSTLLNGARLGLPVHAYDTLGSTMEEAHRLAQTHAAEGTLVVAARQEQGRGRLGRAWISPDGGAYLSLILRPKRPTAAPQLSLVAGLAVAETLRDVADLYPSIHWPNDVLLNDRKVCGILVEARGRFPRPVSHVILGVGVNVTTDPAQLPAGSTSLAASGAAHCSQEDVVAGLCRRFAAWYDRWTHDGFGPIRETLRPWMGLFGRPVRIASGAHRYEGVASDLDESGRLLVRLDSGLPRAFDMGEVTLVR